jgi:hypothetical protein
VPIPSDWETADDARLEAICKSADEVTRYTRERSDVVRGEPEAVDTDRTGAHG